MCPTPGRTSSSPASASASAGPFSQPLRSCSPQMTSERARTRSISAGRSSDASAGQDAGHDRRGLGRPAQEPARGRDVEALGARHADEPAEDELAREAAAGRRLLPQPLGGGDRAVKRHDEPGAAKAERRHPDGRRKHHRRHRPLGRPGDRKRRSERVADDRRPVDADLVDRLAHEPHRLRERERVEHIRVAVAGDVDGDHAVRAPQPLGEGRPVVERAREAVQQHDGVARTPLGHIDTEAVHSEGLRMHRHGNYQPRRCRRVPSAQLQKLAVRGCGMGAGAGGRAGGARAAHRLDARPPRREPGQTLLELGSGTAETGLAAARLVSPGGRVIVSDRSTAMLAAAERRAAELGLANVEMRVLDIEAIDLPDAAVDGALCRLALMLIPDTRHGARGDPPGRAARRPVRGDGVGRGRAQPLGAGALGGARADDRPASGAPRRARDVRARRRGPAQRAARRRRVRRHPGRADPGRLAAIPTSRRTGGRSRP